MTGDQYIGEKFILATEMVVTQARLCTNPIGRENFSMVGTNFFFFEIFFKFLVRPGS